MKAFVSAKPGEGSTWQSIIIVLTTATVKIAVTIPLEYRFVIQYLKVVIR